MRRGGAKRRVVLIKEFIFLNNTTPASLSLGCPLLN
jgi:hypothetical protein